MEESIGRILQFSVALLAAFSVVLWFALSVWAYRDITSRTQNVVVQIFSTLVVVLGFLPGAGIYLLLRPRETIEETYQRTIEEEYLAQELGSIPVCHSCGHGVRDEYLFCPHCGTTIRRNCHACGRLVDADWRICAFCGVKQTEKKPVSARVRSANGNGLQSSIPQEVDLWQVDIQDTGRKPTESQIADGQPAEEAVKPS